MAQNQSNSEGVYKKLSKAVSFSPFKQTIRHKPWQPKASIFTTSQQNPQLQTTTNNDQIKVGRKEVVLPRGHVGNGAPKETKSIKDNDNHKFTDYIRKMKDKMRTASSVGTTAKSSTVRRDSFNDKVSSYINRAKFKIRTTSNVGDDNRGSFK